MPAIPERIPAWLRTGDWLVVRFIAVAAFSMVLWKCY